MIGRIRLVKQGPHFLSGSMKHISAFIAIINPDHEPHQRIVATRPVRHNAPDTSITPLTWPTKAVGQSTGAEVSERWYAIGLEAVVKDLKMQSLGFLSQSMRSENMPEV